MSVRISYVFALVVIASFINSSVAFAQAYDCNHPPGSANLNGMLGSMYLADAGTRYELNTHCERWTNFSNAGKRFRLYVTESLATRGISPAMGVIEAAFRTSVAEYQRADSRYTN